jgi:nucleoside-diphosphate kinase
MAGNRTFTMIKPDAVKAGHIGAILAKINEAGFRIVAMKLTKLSAEKAGEFYAVHKDRPFYGELVEFMSSGPIVAAILEKENAVEADRRNQSRRSRTGHHPRAVRDQHRRKCRSWRRF